MLKNIVVSALMFVVAGSAYANNETVSDQRYWQPYDGAKISFDVLRKGKPFGKHIITFDVEDTGELVARTDVDLKVKIGPFTAFQYQLDSQETWQDGLLVALSGSTNNDGDKSSVKAKRQGQDLVIDGSAYKGAVGVGIIPSSHWNMNQVRSERMLSTESGEVIDMRIIPKGTETLEISGQSVIAERYRLDSDIDIDLWYDDEGRWLKLKFDTRGETIEYRLAELY